LKRIEYTKKGTVGQEKSTTSHASLLLAKSSADLEIENQKKILEVEKRITDD